MSVHIAGDGAAGVQAAYRLQPTVIVLAVELPTVSGYSVCKKLKRTSQTEGIPIVLISSTATEETFEQHRRLRTRADYYLRKPVEAEAVWAQVQHLFEVVGQVGGEDSFMDAFDLEGAFDQILEGEGLESVVSHSGSWDSGSLEGALGLEGAPGASAVEEAPAEAAGESGLAGVAILRRTGDPSSVSRSGSTDGRASAPPPPLSRIMRQPGSRSAEDRATPASESGSTPGLPASPAAVMYRRRTAAPEGETAPRSPISEGNAAEPEEMATAEGIDASGQRRTRDIPKMEPERDGALQQAASMSGGQETGTSVSVRQTSEKLAALKRQDGDSLRLEVNILIEQIEQQESVTKQLQRALDEVRAEADESQRRQTAQMQQLGRTTGRLQEVQSALDARNAEHGALQAEVERLRAALGERDAALASREREAQVRQGEVAELQSQLERARAGDRRGAEAQDGLREALEAIEGLHDELEARARAWSEERETMTEIQLRLSEQVALLEEASELGQIELQEALEALAAAHAERDALREQLDAFRAEAGVRGEVADALQTRADEATERAAAVAAELEGSQERSHALAEEVASAQAELARVRAHRSRMDAMLVQTGERYRAELAKVEAAFNALSTAHGIALDNLQWTQAHVEVVEERLFTASDVLARIGVMVEQMTGTIQGQTDDLSLPDGPMLAEIPAVALPEPELPEPWAAGQWASWESSEGGGATDESPDGDELEELRQELSQPFGHEDDDAISFDEGPTSSSAGAEQEVEPRVEVAPVARMDEDAAELEELRQELSQPFGDDDDAISFDDEPASAPAAPVEGTEPPAEDGGLELALEVSDGLAAEVPESATGASELPIEIGLFPNASGEGQDGSMDDVEVLSLADALAEEDLAGGPPPPPGVESFDDDPDELLDIVADSVAPEEFDQGAELLDAVELEEVRPPRPDATIHAHPGMSLGAHLHEDAAPVGDLEELDALLDSAMGREAPAPISQFHIPPPDEGEDDEDALELAGDEPPGRDGYALLEDVAGMSDEGLMMFDDGSDDEELEFVVEAMAPGSAQAGPRDDSELELFAFDEPHSAEAAHGEGRPVAPKPSDKPGEPDQGS